MVSRWGAAALALLAPLAVRADPFDVRVRLTPERTVVHGQMLLSVEVIHPAWTRPRWEPPPFPGFWPERVSTHGEMTDARRPQHLRRTVFRRALFPTRTGTIDVPPSVLRYEDPDQTEHSLAVPGVQARIDPIPAEGAPADFDGLVGQIEVRGELMRRSIVLGESTRLLVEVYGDANVWDLEAPDLEDSLGSDLELFPMRPRIHLGEQGSRLTARRTFSWDLVPRHEGRFDLPSISVSYFDPQSGSFRFARSEPLSLVVAPRPSAAEYESPFLPSHDRAPLGWAALPYALLWMAGLLAAAFFLLRWARRTERLLRLPSRPSARAALAAAHEGVGTAALPQLLAHAVKSSITARHRVDVTGLTTEEIATRVEDAEALSLLTTLDGIRFAGDTTPPETLLQRVALYVKG